MQSVYMKSWRWLFIIVLLVSFFIPHFGASQVSAASSIDNPIVVENRLRGTKDWRLPNPGFKVGDDIEKQIKGFASDTSINKGNLITFFVSVNPAQPYTIDVFRMGWYQGLGGRLLQHIGPLDGIQQTDCPTGASTGMISCDWDPSYELLVPDNWTSGVYLAVLTNSLKYQNYVIFVVRDDKRVADLLYQQPVTTYQAYNNYPNDKTTGKSLYDSNSYGADTIAGSPRAVQVSFDRPYKNRGAGDFLGVEQYFIHWMERSGYDVSYSTNLDTHARGRNLLNYKGFMSVGHDEYWTRQMYDAVQEARDFGVNLAFFGANDIYWQIRLEPSFTGVKNRIIVAYKDLELDPVENKKLLTVRWRDDPLNRPEQSLIGIQYTANLEDDVTFNSIVINSENWTYTDTGFADGDNTTPVIGGEVDRLMLEFPAPPHRRQTLLSETPITNVDGEADYSNSSIYQAPSGAWVFGAGAITWSIGLDKEGVVDPRLQQMTANILNRFVASQGIAREYLQCIHSHRPAYRSLALFDCQP